jgi:hypothetical protein
MPLPGGLGWGSGHQESQKEKRNHPGDPLMSEVSRLVLFVFHNLHHDLFLLSLEIERPYLPGENRPLESIKPIKVIGYPVQVGLRYS